MSGKSGLIYDLAIVGAGPAGLAVAIRAAGRGLRAIVLDRAQGIPDKACGEGLMPQGVRQLESLGALEGLGEAQPFAGIRYTQEDGSTVASRFRSGNGLGIRRTVLEAALTARALALGAEIRRGAQGSLRSLCETREQIELRLEEGLVVARLAVAADGLHSTLRRLAGLDPPAAKASRVQQRFGLRRHFALSPWSDLVEVNWSRGVEAYVTPVGPKTVNLAFLWHDVASAGFDDQLARFPALAERVGGAQVLSEARGAGPLAQRVPLRAKGRVALVGDAAGYVDAITGQGLSLAFASATRLVEALPVAGLEGDLGPALRRYHASLRGPWLRYALPARSLLALARRPALRRFALRVCARNPALFEALLASVG